MCTAIRFSDDKGNLYFDCANTEGLACGGLNFPGYAQYEKEAVPGKTNVASWELPLWIVANFTTVDEAEAALKDVAVVDSPIVDEYPTSLLHWIVGDGKRSIAVEYTQDGMQIFTDDVDVLANQPGFGWHRENLRNYLNVTSDVPATQTWRAAALTPYGSGTGMRGIPGDYYSPSRFVRIAYLNANYPEQTTEEANVSRMFHELASVAVVDGAARMTNGGIRENRLYRRIFPEDPYLLLEYLRRPCHPLRLGRRADCSPSGKGPHRSRLGKR